MVGKKKLDYASFAMPTSEELNRHGIKELTYEELLLINGGRRRGRSSSDSSGSSSSSNSGGSSSFREERRHRKSYSRGSSSGSSSGGGGGFFSFGRRKKSSSNSSSGEASSSSASSGNKHNSPSGQSKRKLLFGRHSSDNKNKVIASSSAVPEYRVQKGDTLNNKDSFNKASNRHSQFSDIKASISKRFQTFFENTLNGIRDRRKNSTVLLSSTTQPSNALGTRNGMNAGAEQTATTNAAQNTGTAPGANNTTNNGIQRQTAVNDDFHCDVVAWNSALDNNLDPRGQNGEAWDANNLTVNQILDYYPDNRSNAPVANTRGYVFYDWHNDNVFDHMEYYEAGSGTNYTVWQTNGRDNPSATPYDSRVDTNGSGRAGVTAIFVPLNEQ